MQKNKIKKILLNYVVWVLIVYVIAYIECMYYCDFQTFIDTAKPILALGLVAGTIVNIYVEELIL